MIEGQDGLTWQRWKTLVAEVERLGFAGLYRSDHFTNASPPDKDSLELWVSLAYLADHTERIRFGNLVSPVSFRDPAMLARQGAAVDDLSGGRFVLGIGAGWQEREHTLFGYDLGDVGSRMARFEEGLQVATLLLRSDTPVSFEGRFFNLRGATLFPRPARPGGPQICVGGNGQKRTLALATRFADVYNANFIPPATFREQCERLGALLGKAGRDPASVRRTVMTGIYFGTTSDELEGRFSRLRANPNLKEHSTEDIARLLRERGALTGDGEAVRRGLREFEDAGAQEVMLQWLDLDDIAGLNALAEAVL